MFELQVLEMNGKRVLTTKQIALAYEVTEKLIRNNYENNKVRYAEGKHYIQLKGKVLQEFLHTQNLRLQNQNKIRCLYLWTEKGALLHAKSLNTDKAWEVYEYLVDFYFRVKEEPRQQSIMKPDGEPVVNVPVNLQIQKKMEELRKSITGLDALLEILNRYYSEDDYQKIAYAVQQQGFNVADLTYQLSCMKPEIICKKI